MKNAVIKALLSLGISLLGKLIPALGGLLGGPFGFIAGIAINWLAGKLFDWVEQLARFKAIDAQVQQDVAGAKAAGANLKAVQGNTNSTEVERAKALSDFTAAVRTLGKFRLQ